MFWVFHVIRDYGHTLVAGNSRMADRCPLTSNWLPSLRRCKSPCLSCSGTTTCCRPISFTMARLWLIDFEYAGFGTAMFDLAGIASNAGFDAEGR
jgi:thiamine kinase-like enzyme